MNRKKKQGGHTIQAIVDATEMDLETPGIEEAEAGMGKEKTQRPALTERAGLQLLWQNDNLCSKTPKGCNDYSK